MFMKKATLLIALSLVGQASAFRLGISYSFGLINDKGFNEAAYMGAERVRKEMKIDVSAVRPKPDTKEFKFADLARVGSDLIIGIGFQQAEAVEKAARQFPDHKFAIVDSIITGDNVTSVTFREHEGSYLAGVLAGLNTSTNVIGFIGGMDIPVIRRFKAGFEAGVKFANPKAKVVTAFVGTTPAAWSDTGRSREIAKSMRAKGADIIFSAAGGSVDGLLSDLRQVPCLKSSLLPAGVKFMQDQFRQVKKSADYQAKCAGNSRPRFFIGVDTNQNALGDFDRDSSTLNHGLTSVTKQVDSAVYILAKKATQGSPLKGELSLGLKEKGVGLSFDRYNAALVDARQRGQIDSISALISSGQRHVPEK
ncbi:BMP family protein [Deinococcus antarcticus]|uniref:BMP family protein n=1 Tax=Deinococcus antarcticus TaxID=1298767 RepID=A0ABV8A5Q1_9DEIO